MKEVYRYLIPVSLDEETWYTNICIQMDEESKKMFDFYIQNNIREEIQFLYDYANQYDLIITDERIICIGKIYIDYDIEYQYIPDYRVYRFDVIDTDLSLFIQMDRNLFDFFNDMANLGDIPEELNDIIEYKLPLSECNRCYFLECNDEIRSDYTDYMYRL